MQPNDMAPSFNGDYSHSVRICVSDAAFRMFHTTKQVLTIIVVDIINEIIRKNIALWRAGRPHPQV